MADRPKRPRRPRRALTRRQKLLRDALLLPLALLSLYAALDFPIPTAELARRAAERQNFFGPGEILATMTGTELYGEGRAYSDSRCCLVRSGDWYALESVSQDGLAWVGSLRTSVQNDPSLPLAFNVLRTRPTEPLLVLRNDPEIAEVEMLFPSTLPSQHRYNYTDGQVNSMYQILCSVRSTQAVGDCFFLSPPNYWLYHMAAPVVRGYSADGRLLYTSPVPEAWESYDFSLDMTTISYEELYD